MGQLPLNALQMWKIVHLVVHQKEHAEQHSVPLEQVQFIIVQGVLIAIYVKWNAQVRIHVLRLPLSVINVNYYPSISIQAKKVVI